MNTTPTPSNLDIYINDIVDKLRAKYGYADKNRLNPNHKDENKRVVRFYYRRNNVESFVIEIPYTTLYDCMSNQTIPTEIQKLL